MLKLSASRLFTLLSIVPFYWAINVLKMPADFSRVLEVIFCILFLLAGVRFVSALVAFGLSFSLLGKQARASTATGKALMPIINILLWAIALTFFLDNLGFQVTTIIAGLGIMGVAVGLAGQAILADFFSYLVIIMDKPFKIGDFVIVNSSGLSGTIERIGLKTTHLRSVNGEEIICNNASLTSGFVSNYHDIGQRRVRLLFPLPFGLTSDKIREISGKIREFVENNENCVFGRAVLVDFGPWFMNFELVYNVKYGDLAQALDVQHSLNLEILNYLESQEIVLTAPPITSVTPGSTHGGLTL